MTLAEYTEEILLILGGGEDGVTIEIEKSIPKFVNRAFREVKPKVTTPNYITVPFGAGMYGVGSTVDLSKYNIYSVVNVMRPDTYNSLSMNTFDVFGLNQLYRTVTNTEAYANRMLLLQQLNTISTDLDFMWNAHTKQLSVTMNPPYTPYITIQYIPDYKDVEEITEVYWVDIILRLATGYCKQALGRIRSKYKNNTAQYSLDGDQLVAEGTKEVEELQAFLNTNCDLAFPID